MDDSLKIKNIIKCFLENVEEKIVQCPFYFINEHDLQGFLYSKLIENSNYNDYCINSNNLRNFRIHMEYPRRDKLTKKKIGRWDIAILKKNKYDSDDFDEAPVLLGVEIKLNWDENTDEVLSDIDDDMPAIESSKNENDYADWTLAFHINVANKKGKKNLDIKKIESELTKLKRDNPKTWFTYIQSYRDGEKLEYIVK